MKKGIKIDKLKVLFVCIVITCIILIFDAKIQTDDNNLTIENNIQENKEEKEEQIVKNNTSTVVYNVHGLISKISSTNIETSNKYESVTGNIYELAVGYLPLEMNLEIRPELEITHAITGEVIDVSKLQKGDVVIYGNIAVTCENEKYFLDEDMNISEFKVIPKTDFGEIIEKSIIRTNRIMGT